MVFQLKRLSLLNNQTFSRFHEKKLFMFFAHSALFVWLIFEGEQIWMVCLNLTK